MNLTAPYSEVSSAIYNLFYQSYSNQAFRRSFFSRIRSSNSSSVKIQELFLFPLLFSRNCYFSRSFFSSFSPDAKPATKPTNNSQPLYILRLILPYFTAVLNYMIVFIIILLNFIKLFLIIYISIFWTIYITWLQKFVHERTKTQTILVVADALRPLAPPVVYTGTGCKQRCLFCKIVAE